MRPPSRSTTRRATRRRTPGGLRGAQSPGAELHNSVTQSLFSANLVAKVLPDLAQTQPGKVRQALIDAGSTDAERAGRDAYDAFGTAPYVADSDARWIRLFKNLVLMISSRAQLEICIQLSTRPSSARRFQLALYRIVQETLTNVVEHAQARRVEFDLRVHPPVQPGNHHRWEGEIAIHIADDGKGLHIEAVQQGHSGCRS